jgi:SlyX protein
MLSNTPMEHRHDVEHRLNELEIKASFTEDLLDQLNLTIYRQQTQIDSLIQQLARLAQQHTDDAGGAARAPRDELPPHY